MKSRVLRVLESQLEDSGLKPGSKPYERELRARKVEMCKQFQGVSSCWDCKAFDGCELVKQHLRDIRESAALKQRIR